MIDPTRSARPADPAALSRPAAPPAPPSAASPGATADVRRVEAGPPPVDGAKVARLAAEIAAGTYRIEPGRIADAMIAELTGR